MWKTSRKLRDIRVRPPFLKIQIVFNSGNSLFPPLGEFPMGNSLTRHISNAYKIKMNPDEIVLQGGSLSKKRQQRRYQFVISVIL
jgi:hypothetical protein